MNQHISSFHGDSGAVYDYCVFSNGFTPNDKLYYNYMFASLSPEGTWIPVLIGQGDLKQFLSDQQHVNGNALADSTYVLAHISPDEQLRRLEALDMLASHPQAHALTRCSRDSLGRASQGMESKAEQDIPAAGKPARRWFPNHQAFKSSSPSLQSLDTVWARLRHKR